MHRWVLMAVVVWAGFAGIEPACGAGIQAVVGKGGRVQLTRGREKIAEFGAGVYNQSWTRPMRRPI
jgi:hypothetical protein